MESLSQIIKEVLKEHKSLWKKLEEINEAISSTTDSNLPEEKFRTLKIVIESFMKYYNFIGEMKAHEMKEEEFIFQYIDEDLQRKLRKQHEEVGAILDEGRRVLEEFKGGKISIHELRDKMKKLFEKAITLLKEHRSIEDEVFMDLLMKN